MDDNKIADNWDEHKKKLQETYPQLTDEELMLEIGKEKELLERLQKKLGKTKQEIYKWLHIMG